MSRGHKKKTRSDTPQQPQAVYRGRQCQHAKIGCCKACSLGVKYIQRFETENRRDGARQYQGVQSTPAQPITD